MTNGERAEWVSAIGVPAAILGGLWRWTRTTARDRAEQRDRDASQARLVFAGNIRFTVSSRQISAGSYLDGNVKRVNGPFGKAAHCEVVIANDSDEPIYDVTLQVGAGRDPSKLTSTFTPEDGVRVKGRSEITAQTLWMEDRFGSPGNDWLIVVEFTDARGLRWGRRFKRQEAGQPERTILPQHRQPAIIDRLARRWFRREALVRAHGVE